MNANAGIICGLIMKGLGATAAGLYGIRFIN